jgi:tetratricopeptide (TPR) repeat protein
VSVKSNKRGNILAPVRTLATVAAVMVLGIPWGTAHAQQVIRVAGTVKDDAGRAVRGAVITAENPDQAPPRLTATSNERGQFGFIGIRRGVWTIHVEAQGHEAVRFSRRVSAGARQPPLDVSLVREPTPRPKPLAGIRASDIQERIARAEALASSGDLDGAIGAWREVLARVPRLTTVHLRIAALYERKAEPQRALDVYRSLLEVEPGNTKARAAVARLEAGIR